MQPVKANKPSKSGNFKGRLFIVSDGTHEYRRRTHFLLRICAASAASAASTTAAARAARLHNRQDQLEEADNQHSRNFAENEGVSRS